MWTRSGQGSRLRRGANLPHLLGSSSRPNTLARMRVARASRQTGARVRRMQSVDQSERPHAAHNSLFRQGHGFRGLGHGFRVELERSHDRERAQAERLRQLLPLDRVLAHHMNRAVKQ